MCHVLSPIQSKPPCDQLHVLSAYLDLNYVLGYVQSEDLGIHLHILLLL
jgi:hypothetical protein